MAIKHLLLPQSFGHTKHFPQLQYGFIYNQKSQPFEILIPKLNVFLKKMPLSMMEGTAH